MEDCVFCKIVKGEIPSQKVYENDKVLAFLDINPVNSGHTLVIPKSHHKDLFSTPEEVLSDIIVRTKKIAVAIIKAVGADGVNLGMNNRPAAGQVVFHTHLHIMPRFEGDGLKHWPSKKISEDELVEVQKSIQSNLAE